MATDEIMFAPDQQQQQQQQHEQQQQAQQTQQEENREQHLQQEQQQPVEDFNENRNQQQQQQRIWEDRDLNKSQNRRRSSSSRRKGNNGGGGGGGGGGGYGPKPVSDGCNKILAIVGLVLGIVAFVLCLLGEFIWYIDNWWWVLSIIALGCGIAAIVLVYVKPQCNLAIFILSLIAIIFGGIMIIICIVFFIEHGDDGDGRSESERLREKLG